MSNLSKLFFNKEAMEDIRNWVNDNSNPCGEIVLGKSKKGVVFRWPPSGAYRGLIFRWLRG